jgi:hypothetical protein
MTDENFISRWSRRKSASKAGPDRPTADAVPAQAGIQGEEPAEPQTQAPDPLPPVESLTPESDFTPFMKPEVDADVKRKALKVLLQDPRFNVMDGLDVYIDDYSKPDPLPEGWLEKMGAMKYLGAYVSPEEIEKQAAAQAAAKPVEADEPLQKTMPAAALDDAPHAAAADTSADAIPPPEVGKSAGQPEGNSDVLV